MDAGKVSEHGMYWALLAVLAVAVFLMADCQRHSDVMRVEAVKHCCPDD